jgi:TonB-linked SusC/RagA family outer membrane protein
MTRKFKFKEAMHSLQDKCRNLIPPSLVLGLAIILQLMPFNDLLAQDALKRRVTGKVLDASDNSSLPGANVVIKGSRSGVITDAFGDFSLEVIDSDLLVVSFIGFSTQEVAVAGQSKVEVKLVDDVSILDELVVIGYGSVKRKDVTGSISSLRGDELMKSSPTTFDQALQGKVSGVVVQQVSGQPGGAVSVNVRGHTGFGGSGPLYVLDGVMLEGLSSSVSGNNPLAGINPSEIESVDVLKDASATAIYGSKGTDGVIIITTKRGRIAAPRISYEGSYGFQQLPAKVDVMNLQEYATFINERGAVWGFDMRPEFANPQYLGKGTDWQDELFRTAPMQNHSISVSGGNETTQYLISASYYQQDGIVLGSDFDRFSLRLNLDNKTTKWLKIGNSLQLINMDESVNATSTSVINTALSQTPDIAVRNADGSWGGQYNDDGWITNTANPYAVALINKNEVNRKQIFGNLYAEITFAKGLVLRNEMSGNFSMSTEDVFRPSYEMGTVVRESNDATYSFSQGLYTSVKNFLNYSHLFAEHYNVDAMIGHEASLDEGEGVSAYRENFPSNAVQVINAGDPTTAKNTGSKRHSSLESYFGRLSLSVRDKYLLTGNVRNDGSSWYATNNRWVMSYSGALAWKLNNEAIFDNVNNLSELKLRFGYGLTNRHAGRAHSYTSTLGTVATGLSGVSQITQNIASPDLEWEQTKNANIGLDAALFDWRINFSLDFYLKHTEGLAMQTSLPMYSGTAIEWSPGKLDAPWINVGSMENKGFDFRISTTNIQSPSFTWKTDLTVSHNINTVLKINADGAPIMGQYSKTVEGRRLGDFYGYVVEGVYASPVDFLGDPENGIAPAALPINSDGEMYEFANASGSVWYGDIKYKDLNGDGVISTEDQTYLGSPMPKVQMGLNNSFTYRQIDLNVFFNASIGNKIFNQLRVAGENTRTSFGYLKDLNDYARLALVDPNGSPDDVNNVYVVNADTKTQGLRNDDTNGNNRFSDRYIEDGSYVKCKTISLGYTFSERILQRTPLGSVRVYANVTNAFTITNYSGMDPEIGSWDPINAGIDNGFYPQSRVYTLGINVSFNK